MKKINFILLAIAIALVSSTNAQELRKKVLGVESFTYSSTFSQTDVEMVRNQIIAAIQQTGRVIVTDHSAKTSDALHSEAERRKQESAIDANDVADMSTLNANSLLSVHLDQLTTGCETFVEYDYVKQGERAVKIEKGRYPYYTAVITYTIKIIDCETGAVQCQKTFKYSAGKYSVLYHKADFNSSKEARDGIIRSSVVQSDIAVLILNAFKAQGKILQIEDGSPKKAKTVYLNLGSDDGIQVDQVLEVYREIDIAGDVSKKYVGEVEVIDILGASRCLAKVKKGGDVIQQVISAGGNMPVQSRDVQAKRFGGVK